MKDLRGAIALVTGACGGIGSAIASALSEAGATVVRSDLGRSGVDLDEAVDVTDAAAVDALVGRVVDRHGRIDVAVTAAGIGVAGETESIPLEEWHRVVDVNLWGTLHVMRAAYPRMIEQRRGHLLFVASLSGLVGTPLLVPYSVTKHAVVGLTKSLRAEAARHDVGVGALCPGPVDTRMLDDAGGDAGGVTHGVDVRRYLTSAAGRALTPAKVADTAVRAIERNVAITAPGSARWLDLGARWSPGVAERLIARSMRKELAHTA
jgi:NAD(P)-dependent dehydrogenase (short-subunit alcohol dehydrogenase family)